MKKQMCRGAFMFAAMLLSTLSCARVESGDVIGTWVVKAGSREKLPLEHRNAVCKIVVNTDGTFVAWDLPDVVIPAFELPDSVTPQPHDYEPYIRVCSGNGAWSISERSELVLNFQDRLCSDGKRNEEYVGGMNIDRGLSTISLMVWLGDPDSGPGVWFEKEEADSGP